jgi:NADH-quinone oxidoreductase subunit F
LAGCNNKRTVEAPKGASIGVLIYEFVGGKAIKAVQLNGPAGMIISPDELDSAIESHSVEVIDADSNMLDAITNIMAYIQSQSCGKCVFCREGCIQILTILEDIAENKGKPQDLDLIIELGEQMKISSLCDFGRSAPNLVLSGIRLFRSDLEKKR